MAVGEVNIGFRTPAMQVVIREESLPAKLTLNPEAPMSDDDVYAFCMANPDARFERTAQGEIVIVPPAGGDSDHRSVRSIAALDNWSMRSHHGKTFGSSIAFILPNGATLCPTRPGSPRNGCRG